jgi:hypothetical protein
MRSIADRYGGFDYEVIKMADLRKFRPTLINYEHEHLSDEDQGVGGLSAKIERFLSAR